MTIEGLSEDESVFIQKFRALKEKIDEYAIYDFDEEAAKDTSLLYYMSGLKDDAYAYYFTKKELNDYNYETRGNFMGIGINVMTQSQTLTDGLFIYRVIGGSPAEAAGLMTGDKIIEADGVSFINHPYQEAVDILLGEEGTTVNIKVNRKGEEFSFNITTSHAQ